MYKFIDDTTIKRLSDSLYIPVCEDNMDYQEYLKWAKTNTAEEAD